MGAAGTAADRRSTHRGWGGFVNTRLDSTRPTEEAAPASSRPVGHPAQQWGQAASHLPPSEGPGRRLQRLFARSLRILPKPLVKPFAAPYIAGETLEEGITRARQLHAKHGLQSTLDVLGEDVANQADVDAYHQEYRRLIEQIRALPYANLSIKLSALGQLIDEENCVERTEDILRHAAAAGKFVRLDMEDSSTTDSTLRIYRTLKEKGHDNVGIVLQSRLFRTKDDVEVLKPLKPNVRLCIGIYREPPEIALQDKDAMKRHMLELLRVMWENGQHVALATHEEWCIRKALDIAREMGKSDEELEVQMLLGVPRRALQQELVDRGITVRLYVPYGRQWYAYSMRRLENNPDVLHSVVKSLFQGIFRTRGN